MIKASRAGSNKPTRAVARWHWNRHLAGFYKDELFHFSREYVDAATELRKKLLEATFVDLVKKRYAEEYLKTNPEKPTVEGFQDFIKRDYAAEPERAGSVTLYRKRGFEVIDQFEYYTIIFEYKDGQLIYDDIHADAVFDEIWKDIDLIMEFVSKHLGSLSKERAALFRQYLMEDAETYPNSRELKQQIKELFLPFEIAELVQQVREDIIEEIEGSARLKNTPEARNALEVFVGERFSLATGIVPHEDTRQTWMQPFKEQYGVRLWTALYEKAQLPYKSLERIRRFLMSNFYSLFVFLIPYEISNSKKLEDALANNKKDAIEFKRVIANLLDALGGSIFITRGGGYGSAAYLVTKANLSMFYADELALQEVYKKLFFQISHSSSYPAAAEVIELFRKTYRWTKDADESIEVETALQTRKDKALKQYLYSYEEEEKQEDAPARKLLRKIPVAIEDRKVMDELVEFEKFERC